MIYSSRIFLPTVQPLAFQNHASARIPPHSFVPNCGAGVSARVNRAADPAPPLLAHALRDAEAGLTIILPLSTVRDAAHLRGLRFHVSERFLRDKDSNPMGRPTTRILLSASPPNHPDLKDAIAAKWGAVTHLDIADVCQAFLTACAATPRGRVWGSRVDIKAAYTRVLIKPRDALILATLVTE